MAGRAAVAAGLAVLAMGCRAEPADTVHSGAADTAATDPGAAPPTLSEAVRTTVDQVILPSHEDLLYAATSLDDSVEAFCASPTLASHEAAVVQLAATRRHLKVQEAWAVGPTVDRGLADAVDPWPEVGEAIEAGIAGSEAITPAVLAATEVSDHARGYPAIGYLLHGDGDGTVGVFQADGDGRRCAWLQAASSHALAELAAWQTDWLTAWPTGDADADALALASSWGALAEGIDARNLTAPLGEGTAAPELVEARYSAASLELVFHRLDGLEQAYEGGLQAWLLGQSGGDDADSAVLADLDAARDAVAAVPWPLDSAVVNEVEAVEQAAAAAGTLAETLQDRLVPRLGG